MERVYLRLTKLGLLFGLSVLLVAGFYFHSEFYALGLYPLLAIGGAVTFLVILAFRIILTGEIPRGRPSGDIIFPLEAGNAVLDGGIRAAFVPQRDEPPTVGQVVRARYPTSAEFGRLLVVDAVRKYVSDLTDADARMAGYQNLQALLAGADLRTQADEDSFTTLIHFRALGGRH